MWHQGLPPLDTTKYGMNAFFRSVPCRDSLGDPKGGPAERGWCNNFGASVLHIYCAGESYCLVLQ
eukprot:376645-Pyramimonas_sp.AAC.1